MAKFPVVFVAAIAMFAASAAKAQVVVIANPSVNASSVSKSDLKKVFTGASGRLSSGSHVTPVLLKEGPTHNTFLSAYVEKTPIAILLIWRGLVMSGQGSMPKTFDSEEAMVQYVARTPGSIGYIASATPHDEVKVLKVE